LQVGQQLGVTLRVAELNGNCVGSFAARNFAPGVRGLD
jgi:hypothetical protein